MRSVGPKKILWAALIGIGGLMAFHSAFAEPPLQKVTGALSSGSKGISENSRAALAQRLDLRPPSEIVASQEAPATSPAAGSRRLFGSETLFRSESRAVTAPSSGHISSPMENLAHNFRQEGLPVARLFENRDSLVHLGLSPKGKPGLWIVHKLH